VIARSKIRHQLFLTPEVSARFEALAAKPGTNKSAMLEQALVGWLNRRGTSELDDYFGQRLDRISTTLGRIERDGHVLIETLSLFVRYELSIHAPLADNDQAGRAVARQRFQAFTEQVARQMADDRRTIDGRPREAGQ
jgi:hypothetical protein